MFLFVISVFFLNLGCGDHAHWLLGLPLSINLLLKYFIEYSSITVTDVHIRTSPVFPGDTLDVQMQTFDYIQE